MLPARLETKLMVHVLSHVMKAPPVAASDVVYRVALMLMRSAEDGLTYGGPGRTSMELSGAYKALPSNVRMESGLPWEPTGVLYERCDVGRAAQKRRHVDIHSGWGGG